MTESAEALLVVVVSCKFIIGCSVESGNFSLESSDVPRFSQKLNALIIILLWFNVKFTEP